MKTSVVLIPSMLALFGCQAIVETEVSLTDILESKSKYIDSNLYLEVAACNSYEDSRKLSDSVIEAQQLIPRVFSDAKYIDCFRQEMTSYAQFSTKIALDKDADGTFYSKDHVNIISNENTLLTVAIPKEIKNKMDQLKKESFGINSIDLEFSIDILNDTNKPFTFTVISAYVSGQPYIYETLTAEAANGSFNIKLSDVSKDLALDQEKAMVLIHASQE